MNYNTLFSNYRQTIKQLLILVLPILAAHQIGALIPFLNTTLAGRHGPLWFAATGLANTIFCTIMGMGWGILTSVGILTAKQLGKNEDLPQTGLILKASLLTTLIISIPIMVLLKYIEPILLLYGQNPEISQLTQEYLNGFLWIVFVDLAKFSVFQFAISHHRIQGPLVATAISIPLIFLFNTLLVPSLGLYGLGLGTAIAYWIVSLGLWAYCYRDRLFKECLNIQAPLQQYIQLSMEQFKLGIPMGAMSMIELMFFVIIGLWVGKISTAHFIAHQISIQWLSFALMGAVSFSEAITILVAKAYAKNHLSSMTKFLRAGLWMSVLFMTIISFIYWLCPNWLIQISLKTHNSDMSVNHINVITLALCGIFQIADGLRIALSGVLRGLSDAQYPMWVTLFAFWMIGLPIAYFFTFTMQWQQFGLWFGMTCAVIVMIGLQFNRMNKLLALDPTH